MCSCVIVYTVYCVYCVCDATIRPEHAGIVVNIYNALDTGCPCYWKILDSVDR